MEEAPKMAQGRVFSINPRVAAQVSSAKSIVFHDFPASHKLPHSSGDQSGVRDAVAGSWTPHLRAHNLPTLILCALAELYPGLLDSHTELPSAEGDRAGVWESQCSADGRRVRQLLLPKKGTDGNAPTSAAALIPPSTRTGVVGGRKAATAWRTFVSTFLVNPDQTADNRGRANSFNDIWGETVGNAQQQLDDATAVATLQLGIRALVACKEGLFASLSSI
jgi:hypothetical protein